MLGQAYAQRKHGDEREMHSTTKKAQDAQERHGDEHKMHSATKNAQDVQEKHGQVSEITHMRCKYLKLHEAVKKKAPHTQNAKGCVTRRRENGGEEIEKGKNSQFRPLLTLNQNAWGNLLCEYAN